MRGSKLGLLAAGALVAGLAGCSLPEVLPIASGTTPGPSPYGPWYEQHWATNAVLLAAADQPEGATPAPAEEQVAPDDAGAQGDPANQDGASNDVPLGSGDAATAPRVDVPVEASAAPSQRGVDFDNSTSYQFPASSFVRGGSAKSEPEGSAPLPASPQKKAGPAAGGPIRY